MSEDEVLLGAAIMLIKWHQARAPVMVAERIGDLAVEGDLAGVAVWQAIARHMDAIMRAGSLH
ncbi:hypothetical protein JQK15_25685 [Sphingobium sp. BHU LFT2]|nr:hypothetical protein [Sphingobium sp. BHU LFT2]MBT2246892.1 hypothetical protein [Sphingobium sp. BHU LFT2]